MTNPWDIIGDICRTIDRMNSDLEEKLRSEEENRAPDEPPENIVLGKEDLRNLKWLGADQLRAIFGGGTKKKVTLEKDNGVYQQLRWFSAEQLDAIFGGNQK